MEKRMLRILDYIVFLFLIIKSIFNIILYVNLFLRYFIYMGELFVYSS